MLANELVVERESATRANMLIILIDEEKIVLKTLGDFLADLGHEVLSFNSVLELREGTGPEASGHELASSADLILMDTGAPKEQQGNIIEKIHADFPSADILLMSDHRLTLPSTVAISNRVFGYLQKPVRLAELELDLARIKEGRYGRD
ncbi:MAG TPA: response regulator [bacterium]|nr:response regulator [bacterium]